MPIYKRKPSFFNDLGCAFWKRQTTETQKVGRNWQWLTVSVHQINSFCLWVPSSLRGWWCGGRNASLSSIFVRQRNISSVVDSFKYVPLCPVISTMFRLKRATPSYEVCAQCETCSMILALCRSRWHWWSGLCGWQPSTKREQTNIWMLLEWTAYSIYHHWLVSTVKQSGFFNPSFNFGKCIFYNSIYATKFAITVLCEVVVTDLV